MHLLTSYEFIISSFTFITFTIRCFHCSSVNANYVNESCRNVLDEEDSHRRYREAFEPLHSVVFHELDPCVGNQNTAALFYDGSDVGHEILARHIGQGHQPLIRIDISCFRNVTEQHRLLYSMHMNHGAVTYVLLVSEPNYIIKTAESVFFHHKNGPLFSMPHFTRWLVIVQSSTQFEKIVAAQKRSVFDNIAVLKVKILNENSDLVKVKKAVTFQWRGDRSRYPRRIHNRKASESTCEIFPNIKYGMNGRELKVIAKVYTPHTFDTRFNNDSNKFEYSGFNFDILHTLSQNLNFSYTFWPPFEDGVSISWGDYSKIIRTGQVDIAVNQWAHFRTDEMDVSITYPIIFDQVLGIYVPQIGSEGLSTFLLCPFPWVVLLFLIVSIAYYSLLYIIMEYSTKSFVEESARRDNKTCFSTINKLVIKFVTIFSSMTFSVMNIDSLPRPRFFSGRWLIGVWSIGMVIFYGAYASFLTSSMISQRSELPFNTYEEMIADGRFSWGTTYEAPLYELMGRSKNPTIVELRKNLIVINQSMTEVFYTRYTLRRNNFVNIFYEKMYKLMLRDIKDPDLQEKKNDIVYMAEKLYPCNMGFMLPRDSGLENILSRNIMRLHENGIIHSLLSKYVDLKDMPEKRTNTNRTVKVADILFLLCLCGGFITAASCVLIIEHVLQYRRNKALQRAITKVTK